MPRPLAAPKWFGWTSSARNEPAGGLSTGRRPVPDAGSISLDRLWMIAASMTAECDVVIVGAGAAGLAAGRTLRAAGMHVRVLEASGRTGGRAFTDTVSLGQPWDMGCHWLHSATDNPFVPIADALGFRYRRADGRASRRLHLGRRWADAAEEKTARATVETIFDAVRAAGEAGRDVSAATVWAETPHDTRWDELVRCWFTLMSANEPERISCVDFAAYHDTDANWPVTDGYGALVRAHGAEVPVTLACPVRSLDWSGKGVRVITDAGDIAARAVIVTVSTRVIAEERLAFFPALPAALQAAFAALPLGVAEKVALSFDRDVFGIAEHASVGVLDLDHPATAPIQFQLLPGAQPAAIGHVAGDAAARLMAAGPGAMTAAVLDALCAAFGEDLRRRLRASFTTGWVADPFIGGGYSSALPGLAGERARLFEPVGERIYFAGEAVSSHAFSTCHGAHLSGIAAAEKALAQLSGAET